MPLDAEDWRLFETLWSERAYADGDVVRFSDFVFHRRGRPVEDSTFNRQFNNACVKAGLGVRDKDGRYSGRIFHDCRRTYARNAVAAGVPPLVVQSVMGHKTLAMLIRYSIFNPKAKLDGRAQIREYLAKQAAKSNVADFPGQQNAQGVTQ